MITGMNFALDLYITLGLYFALVIKAHFSVRIFKYLFLTPASCMFTAFGSSSFYQILRLGAQLHNKLNITHESQHIISFFLLMLSICYLVQVLSALQLLEIS